ncbi:MAG: epoxyqueuosine reductase [Candidatus Odinarchaeota archaeon]
MNIRNLIISFIEDHKNYSNYRTDWEEPIVGFADAKDPLFFELKEKIDKSHKLPTELLKKAKTVISYFIPFNKKIILSNTKGKRASKEWAIAYVETNKLMLKLNTLLRKELKKEAFDSVKIPDELNFDEKKLIASWSQKHIAYIAGLGKFGLHKMLITEKGCCGRLGSLITSAEIEPTKRREQEYCLYFYNKSCSKCIENCIYDILDFKSFDRQKCYNICLENAQIYSHLGIADVCGKCACGLPCSHTNPVKKIIK